MRIIAGRLGGRQFDSPHGHKTHPMSEKGRGALFNALGDIGGLSVLDPFAGSGALSFEAISRGASHAIAIDSDRSAQMTIAKNLKSLGLRHKVKLIKAAASAWLTTSDDSFDLVLLDPPFENLQPELLVKLANRVNTGGLVVLSLPPNTEIQLSEGFDKVLNKTYGDNQLVFYRRIS